MHKFCSLSLVGLVVFLSGMNVGWGASQDSNYETVGETAEKADATSSAKQQPTRASLESNNNAAIQKDQDTINNLRNSIVWEDSTSDKAIETNAEIEKLQADIDARKTAGETANPNANAWDGTDPAPGTLGSNSYMFNPADISASTHSYTNGTKNIDMLLSTVINTLMVIIASVAVLLIAAGGLMIATSANSDERLSKGKALIIYNLQALGISLSAYLIISFIIWLIGT